MTRRFLSCIFLPTFLLATQISLRAGTTDDALAKSAIFEKNVLYLRVGSVGKNLAEEIQSAQDGLTATNKIAGTVLDLRFANGSDLDSEKAVADLFASKNLPLAILVNGGTRGAAVKLATDLRGARDGLIFGDSTEVKPDIAIVVKAEDEKKFLESPYGTLAQDETNSAASTNNLLPFVDHTTEADLVRAKIKDGDEDEDSPPPHADEPPTPFIRDPVLARAVDLIKSLAIVRQSHS